MKTKPKQPRRSPRAHSPQNVSARAKISRRRLLGQAGAAAVLWSCSTSLSSPSSDFYRARQGRINQSVVPWCFQPMPEPELILHAARMGLKSVELVSPKHWPLLKEHGLICAISSSHGFAKGFAHREEHEECWQSLRASIDATAQAGYPSVITFSGFRRGLSDDEATHNMIEGLKGIVGYAEKKKVTLCLEMLNSRVDVQMKGHPDYFCDHIDPTVELCRQVGSDRLKVLFDLYHVQIMDGDVISRIRQHHEWIGHYHTAGVPGRNEIDDSQELNYAALMKAIVATGYQGYVGQEFIPLRDKAESLNQAVRICDV